MLFANRMLDGNMKDALRLLSMNTEGGVLNPSNKITCGNNTTTVLEALKNKHLEGNQHPEMQFYQWKATK